MVFRTDGIQNGRRCFQGGRRSILVVATAAMVLVASASIWRLAERGKGDSIAKYYLSASNKNGDLHGGTGKVVVLDWGELCDAGIETKGVQFRGFT
jgi:hypothetical protein